MFFLLNQNFSDYLSNQRMIQMFINLLQISFKLNNDLQLFLLEPYQFHYLILSTLVIIIKVYIINSKG